MTNYDFLNLSYYEFELLVRDVLQEREHKILENFTSGRDSGIDLRYSTTQENDLIVQCKRYKTFSEIFSTLKKEFKKVIKLQPKRFILATSVGLTPNNKVKIYKLFHPFIKKYEDILDKEAINNLLGKYPKIERNHFKLWLSSTNILEKVIHSNIVNQSIFERNNIKENIKKYVLNDSYFEALRILKLNNFLIISGIPGIGKTMLAHMLIYNLLAQGDVELIFLSESLSEGTTLYKKDQSQIFFYDDFLGRSFLETHLKKNEDNRLLSFIETIKDSSNKIFILTTREYILNQALQESEVLSNKSFDIGKYILDLAKYTKSVKGRILYNHIFFSRLPVEYIDNILANNSFLKIIEHKNYSPRIIELVTKEEPIWRNIDPNHFCEVILSLLNNPEQIWKHAFENQITPAARSLLIILTLCNPPLLLEDLYYAINKFYLGIENKTFDYLQFKKCLKELENTFIKIERNNDNNIIDFFNPSVGDFLSSYIRSNEEYITDYLKHAAFINEFFSIFKYKENNRKDGKILGSSGLQNITVETITTQFSSLSNSNLSTYASPTGYKVVKEKKHGLFNINLLVSNIDIKKYGKLNEKIVSQFLKIDIETIDGSNLSLYIKLLNEFCLLSKFDAKRNLPTIFEKLEAVDLLDFYDFEGYYPEEFEEFISSDTVKEEIKEKCAEFIEYCSTEELEEYENDLEDIGSYYKVSLDDELEDVQQKIADEDEFINSQMDDIYDRVGSSMSKNDIPQDSEIIEMFKTLKDKS